MKIAEPGPCWVLRDDRNDPWNEDHDVHRSREAADAEVARIRDDHEGDPTPEAAAAGRAAYMQPGAARDAMYAFALRDFAREAARLRGLRSVRLDEPCHQIRCDGCGAEPESGEFSHLHFSSRHPFQPGESCWAEVDGRHYCESCTMTLLCSECQSVLGEGADHDERLCASCLADEQAASDRQLATRV